MVIFHVFGKLTQSILMGIHLSLPGLEIYLRDNFSKKTWRTSHGNFHCCLQRNQRTKGRYSVGSVPASPQRRMRIDGRIYDSQWGHQIHLKKNNLMIELEVLHNISTLSEYICTLCIWRPWWRFYMGLGHTFPMSGLFPRMTWFPGVIRCSRLRLQETSFRIAGVIWPRWIQLLELGMFT